MNMFSKRFICLNDGLNFFFISSVIIKEFIKIGFFFITMNGKIFCFAPDTYRVSFRQTCFGNGDLQNIFCHLAVSCPFAAGNGYQFRIRNCYVVIS